jgi:alcohol dehydrogenase class IV
MTDSGYRPAVGVMLINPAGKAWVGQRLDNSLEAWQMPQGGLDPGEDPLEGALRELNRDTGIPSLRALNVPADRYESLIGKMSADALASGSPANNPRSANAEEIAALFRQSYKV